MCRALLLLALLLTSCQPKDKPTVPLVPLACVPTTCERQGVSCGEILDNCGAVLPCGECKAPQTCGGGGEPGRCGCTPDNVVACEGRACGDAQNNCGETISCGSCTAPALCG